MIKIDEIYSSLFMPYLSEHCQTKSFKLRGQQIQGGCAVGTHYPFGTSSPESLQVNYVGDFTDVNFIYFLDQEPIQRNVQNDTFKLVKKSMMGNYNSIDDLLTLNPNKKKFAMVTSELNSMDVAQLQSYFGGKQFYYFFHGWAALDWFRGYDKTWLIQDPYKRNITKTFFSPNRIIGGARDHRVAMLYWFEKLGLMHNHISAPKICPVENTDIVDIGARMSGPYPDIVHVLKDMQLPRMFAKEDTQIMSSYYLSNFNECAESMIYHVTETVAAGYKQHFTEKIFKPICMRMPFVLTGTAGALKYLQGYGFQTFASVWDESYDLIDDDYQRYEAVAQLLKQIDLLNTNEKEDIFTKCLPIIQHNYQHFYGGTFEGILWNELKGMLKSLNDYFSH